MNTKIKEYHYFLQSIYEDAENLRNQLIDLSYDVTLNSYNHHYILINSKYEKQKYFMPVISIKDKGDICFNLDGIAFEFYLVKEKLLSLDKIEELLEQYSYVLNIYEFDNCTNDIYVIGDNKDEILQKVVNSLDSKFGISIDCSHFPKQDIISHFDHICLLLDI